MAEKAYIGLGSNLGDREENLLDALRLLGNLGEIADVSSIYESDPWGNYEPQSRYLNMAIAILTELQPPPLLRAMLEIESAKFGRIRLSPQYSSPAPRVMDLDMLFYGNRIVDERSEEFLFVPHVRLHQRSFVLTPLCEIAAKMVHPTIKNTIADLAELVEPQGISLWAPPPTSVLLNKQTHERS